MKKADKPVVSVNGDNNKVEVKVNITKTTSKSAALMIALSVVIGAALLAVSHCCPELLADVVRVIVSMVIGS